MSKCKIDRWTYIEAPLEEQPDCFTTYEFEGTHEGRPFHCKVSMEIDGRDAEYEQISGLDMGSDLTNDEIFGRWDDLLEAMNETPGLNEDMEARVNAGQGY